MMHHNPSEKLTPIVGRLLVASGILWVILGLCLELIHVVIAAGLATIGYTAGIFLYNLDYTKIGRLMMFFSAHTVVIYGSLTVPNGDLVLLMMLGLIPLLFICFDWEAERYYIAGITSINFIIVLYLFFSYPEILFKFHADDALVHSVIALFVYITIFVVVGYSLILAMKEINDLRRLLDKAPTPMFGTDTKGRIQAWNPALEILSGFKEVEVLGRPLADFVEKEHSSQVAQDGSQSTYLFRTKSGRSAYLVVSNLQIDSSGNTGVQKILDRTSDAAPISYFVAQNLDDLKASQAKLIHATRLAALGEMAGSFAHEVNQPLNVIALSAGNLLERAKDESVTKEYLLSKAQRIQSQALRAGKIIQGIRSYVLEIGDEELVEFDPVKGVASAQDLMAEQLRLDSVLVQVDAPSYPIRIKGRPLMFEQAIVNLFMNSMNAMKDIDLSEKIINVSFSIQGRELIVFVKDNGPGIPDEILSHIFAPFFSTNKKDGGTGIGLFMTETIIKELNGSIKALNVSNGACFKMIFPICASQIEC